MKRRNIIIALATAVPVAALVNCTNPTFEDLDEDLTDEVMAALAEAGAGADCSHFKSYPPPPAYVAPGDHCKIKYPNPGCAPGTGDVCTIPESGWPGPYNIYKDNCHDAASCGVEAGVCAKQTTGIYSCTGATEGLEGHTVNYTIGPAPEPNVGKNVICLSEPQHPKPDETKCCWVQSGTTPKTKKGEPGYDCYRHRCGSQSKDEGGAALEPGQCWPTSSAGGDAPCGTADKITPEAIQCCIKHAKRWDGSLSRWCSQSGYEKQLPFRCADYTACVTAAGWKPPK